MSDFEDEIERLKREIAISEGKKSEIPTYSYSKITYTDLRKLFDIEEKINKDILNQWLDNSIVLDESIIEFLNNLIQEEASFIKKYNEEDLKINFISPILRSVNFKMIDIEVRDFYEASLSYTGDNFILQGTPDYFVSKGLFYSKKPYFFIQEFKKGKKNSDPEPQLLAEMISGLEISKVDLFKGAYIIGAIWNFVILEKLGENKYQYFVSANFDSTKIDDLKSIYKNLMFIKNEVIDNI